MPLYRRVPKRGFLPPYRRRYQIVNLTELAKLEDSDIGPEELAARGLVRSAQRPVKILGQGSVGRAINVRAHAFSASAKEKIEADGGSAHLID
jgi:large subunit ribosomal protein L15